MPQLRYAEQILRFDGPLDKLRQSAKQLVHFIDELNEVNAVVAENDVFERIDEIREAEG